MNKHWDHSSRKWSRKFFIKCMACHLFIPSHQCRESSRLSNSFILRIARVKSSNSSVNQKRNSLCRRESSLKGFINSIKKLILVQFSTWKNQNISHIRYRCSFGKFHKLYYILLFKLSILCFSTSSILPLDTSLAYMLLQQQLWK